MARGFSSRILVAFAAAAVMAAAPALAADPARDRESAVEMRSALDSGDIQSAMRLARGLVHSDDADTRHEVVQVLAWCGKKALPELIELINDPDLSIAHEAYTAWNTAMLEIPSNRIRAYWIQQLVSGISDGGKINQALMKLTEMEESLSLTTLERIIINNRGRPSSTCAKDLFEHIAGEPWASEERTRKLVGKE